MPLVASYNSKNEIPEGLEKFYVEKGDKFVLEVEGMAPASELADLRSRVDEFRSNNIQLNERLKAFDGKKVLTAEEQEEFARLVEQEESIRDKKLIDSGKIDELLNNRTEKMRADYEARIKSLEKSNDELKTSSGAMGKKLSSVVIESEISRLLSDQGIAPVKGAMADIYARAGQVWKANEEGVLQAVNANGDVVYGTEGKELTLQEWGQSLVKDAPYLFQANTGSGGSGGTKTPGSGGDGQIRIPRTDESMKSKHIEDLASGKAVLVD